VATDDLLSQQARALGDPTRLAIFRMVATAAEPVDVERLTAHVNTHPNAVRQHLAKLVSARLVQPAQTPIPAGRRRGRPRLAYEVHPSAAGRWQRVEPYEHLSTMLAEVVHTGLTPVEVGRRRAQPAGPDLEPAQAVKTVSGLMNELGFLPRVESDGGEVSITLRNCPFASAVLADGQAICELHLGMAQGALQGSTMAVVELVARDPREGNCLLRLGPRPA
jgi:predicted ArsR family transcriptional regulator